MTKSVTVVQKVKMEFGDPTVTLRYGQRTSYVRRSVLIKTVVRV